MQSFNFYGFLLISLFATQCLANSYNLIGIHITWENDGDKTLFKITSKLDKGVDVNDAWIAFGINNSTEMEDANAVVCRNSPTKKDVSHYLNVGNMPFIFDETNPQLGLSNTQVGSFNGNITCSFARDNFNPKTGYFHVDFVSEYYILVAYGSGDLSYHTDREESKETFNFAPLVPMTPPTDLPPETTKPPLSFDFFSFLTYLFRLILSFFGL